jgi:hypothetical protein
LTGGNYYFLQLLHISVFILSGLFGMKTVIDALKFSCEKQKIYPRVGVTVFPEAVSGRRGQALQAVQKVRGKFLHGANLLLQTTGWGGAGEKRIAR